MSQAFNNLIKFPLTQEFIDYWSQTAIADRIKDGYLDLRVKKSDYTLVTKGKGVNTSKGYRNIYGTKDSKILGFRVRVKSQHEDLYLAFLELAEYTAGENCDLVSIDVIDYCHRHNREDRERGYRIRRGVFEGEFSQVTGTDTIGYIDCDGEEKAQGDRYGSGFSFKFMETVNTGVHF